MKTVFPLLMLGVLLFAGCELTDKRIRPSGEIITETRSNDPFTRLDVEDAFDVEVRRTEGHSVTIETHENIQEVVEVIVFGGQLTVRLEDGYRLRRGDEVKVIIETPELTEIEGSGATDFRLMDTFTTEDFRLRLSGASELSGTLNVTNLDATLRGASDLFLEGSADSYELEAEGASESGGYDFVVDKFVVDLEGASEVLITVTEELYIEASGASELKFRGDGQIISQDISGSSRVIRE